jgi:hypothetical protein
VVTTFRLYYDGTVAIALTIILSFVVALIADDMRYGSEDDSTGHSPRNHHTWGG